MLATHITIVRRCDLAKDHPEFNHYNPERIVYSDHYDLESALREVRSNPELKLAIYKFIDEKECA